MFNSKSFIKAALIAFGFFAFVETAVSATRLEQVVMPRAFKLK